MFLFALLVIVAFVYTIRKTPEKLVNRDQTEEWKGWMQVSIMKPKKTYLLWFPNGMLPVREEINLDPGSLSIASLVEIKVPYEQTRTSFHVQCSNRSGSLGLRLDAVAYRTHVVKETIKLKAG